jgi:nucleoside-diphosphate-sugar epimerase
MSRLDLVTGGSGFVGTELVEHLLKRGRRVRIFDRVEPDKSVKDKVEFFRGDIRDFEAVNKACKGVEVVYHTVAVVPISKSGQGFERINAGGTRNVLEAAMRNGVKSVVHMSSSSVYKIPKKGDIITEDYPCEGVGQYGRSKYHAEQICHEYMKKGLKISIIRPRTILGIRRLGIYSILFDWISRGKNIYIFGKGDNLFSYVSNSDLAEATILASKKGHGETFNVSAEEYGTYRGDIERLIKKVGSKSKVISLNATLCRVALRLLDKIGLSPLSEWHYETVDKEYVFDISKAKRMLGWKPRDSNEKMFLQAYKWYLKNRKTVEKRFGTRHRLATRQGILKLLRFFS